MDLKGAEIRNILEMCMSIGTKTRVPLNVNVPYYQRPYRWDEKRITSLIEDFHKNKQENAAFFWQSEDKGSPVRFCQQQQHFFKNIIKAKELHNVPKAHKIYILRPQHPAFFLTQ